MKNTKAIAILATFAPIAVIAGTALAYSGGSTDDSAAVQSMTTFYDEVKDWLTGPLGVILAITCLAVGLGIAIMQQSLMVGVVALFFAALVNYGPTIIEGVAGASEVSGL